MIKFLTSVILFFVLIIELCFSQGLRPTTFLLEKSLSDSTETINELKSNSISEIKLQGKSTVWMGTNQGLAMIKDAVSVVAIDSLTIEGPDSIMILTDGISAIAVKNDSSMIVAAATSDGETPIGSGLYFTEN